MLLVLLRVVAAELPSVFGSGTVLGAPVLLSGDTGYSVGQPARWARTPPAQQPRRAGSQAEADAAERASCGEVCPLHHGQCSAEDAQKRSPRDEMPHTKHVCPSTAATVSVAARPPAVSAMAADGRPAAVPVPCALAALCFCFFCFLVLPLGGERPCCNCKHAGQPTHFRQALHLCSHETLYGPADQRKSVHQPSQRCRLLGVTTEAASECGGGGGDLRRFFTRLRFDVCACACACACACDCGSCCCSGFRLPFFLLRCRAGELECYARAAGVISARGGVARSLPVEGCVQLRPSAVDFVGGPTDSAVETLTAVLSIS